MFIVVATERRERMLAAVGDRFGNRPPLIRTVAVRLTRRGSTIEELGIARLECRARSDVGSFAVVEPTDSYDILETHSVSLFLVHPREKYKRPADRYCNNRSPKHLKLS